MKLPYIRPLTHPCLKHLTLPPHVPCPPPPRITLKVDDLDVNSTRLERGSQAIASPTAGGLFFGGTPPDVDAGGMAGAVEPLRGCISDVIINDQ